MERRDKPSTDRRHANYVLLFLTIVYVLNFFDRQILNILANDVKRDLHLTDADTGFLFGTAFPYMAGFVSTVTGSLCTGILRLLIATPVAMALVILAWRSVPAAGAGVVERAHAAGEPV